MLLKAGQRTRLLWPHTVTNAANSLPANLLQDVICFPEMREQISQEHEAAHLFLQLGAWPSSKGSVVPLHRMYIRQHSNLCTTC